MKPCIGTREPISEGHSISRPHILERRRKLFVDRWELWRSIEGDFESVEISKDR